MTKIANSFTFFILSPFSLNAQCWCNASTEPNNIDKSLKFYGELLGFKEVMFDYTGSLPRIMEKVTGKPETKARVVMLKNQNMGPVGLGMIKLVHLLPPDKPEPCTVVDTTTWGDIGVAEVCFNTRGIAKKVFAELLEKGVKATVTPASGCFPPYETVANFEYMEERLAQLFGICPYKIYKRRKRRKWVN